MLDQTHVALIAAVGAKILISAADALPAPKADASYWVRFAYDFIQNLAQNSGKVGDRKNQVSVEVKGQTTS